MSKLVLVAVMLRGRHRGLPVALDKAVLLPGDEETRREEHDGMLRRARSTNIIKEEEDIEMDRIV